MASAKGSNLILIIIKMIKNYKLIIFPLISLLTISCQQDDDDSFIRPVVCGESEQIIEDGDFQSLIGKHTLAVQSSKHKVFSMGENRTEFDFTVCESGEIIISDLKGNRLKSFMFEESDSEFISWGDHSTLNYERFYEVSPFHVKFVFYKEFYPRNFTHVTYHTYLEGLTSWGSSSGIRGSKLPAELINVDGTHSLYDSDIEYSLEIDNGVVTLFDVNGREVDSFSWDGEYDEVNVRGDSSEQIVVTLKNNYASYLSFSVHINTEEWSVHKLVYVNENWKVTEFLPETQ